MKATFPLPGSGRDHRLDIFRGLALVTIFINHVPHNVYEHLTSRNFGFSDAAEAFVLMSGIAVGLAYSRGFKAGDFGTALLRVWKRAGTIYVAHVVTSAMAIAIIGAGILFLGAYRILPPLNYMVFLERPIAAMIGLPTLGHQIGYFNILPLYFVLLLVSPVYIIIGLRSRLTLVAVAVAIWMLAGSFRLNFPNFPTAGGWFFNPMSWQLIYAIGIAGGLSTREGQRFVPYRGWLLGISAAFLIFSLVWVQFSIGGLPGGQHLPFFIIGFDKTFVSLPRLLHVLALTYVLTNLTAVSQMLKAPAFRPVELIGQHGLAVFVTGSVLAIALQVLRVRFETTALEDGALLAAGILIQYGVARLLSLMSDKARVSKAPEARKRLSVEPPSQEALEPMI